MIDPALGIGTFTDVSDGSTDPSPGSVLVVFRVTVAVTGDVVVVETVSRLAGTVMKAVLMPGLSIAVSGPVA